MLRSLSKNRYLTEEHKLRHKINGLRRDTVTQASFQLSF